MVRKIPFFDYPGLYAEHEAEFKAAMEKSLQRGAYIMQQELFDFEASMASWLGVRHVLGLADGTVALTFALKLAGIKAGDEVILPSHTFVATAAAVHHLGAIPVLCDCGPDHMIDVASAEALVTKKTKAIMPVQLNGRIADMDAVQTFAANHGLKVVEDSCQALGAKYKGKYAGTFGVGGSFSFYPAKVLGCFGDGGALILLDDGLAEQARQMRDHGRDAKTGKVVRFGYNARLDNLQAAILQVKFNRHDTNLKKRRALAQIYCDRLKKLEAILLPPPPTEDGLRYDIFQNFEIEADRRDDLRKYLADRGIGTIMQWGGHMIHQFEALGLKHNAPYAEKMSSKYCLLPMHHLLNDDDVHYVCDAIKKFYGGHG